MLDGQCIVSCLVGCMRKEHSWSDVSAQDASLQGLSRLVGVQCGKDLTAVMMLMHFSIVLKVLMAPLHAPQVDRYKQLLLKQRDIMIALTSRLNERDEQIFTLQVRGCGRCCGAMWPASAALHVASRSFEQ